MGKEAANRNRPGQKFSNWVKGCSPGLGERSAQAAMQFAKESATIAEIPADLTHPEAILSWHRDQQATQALPPELQQSAPPITSTALPSDTAQRINKLHHRKEANCEGSDVAASAGCC